MEQIAFILGSSILYWKNIIWMLALAAAVCTFLALHCGQGGGLRSGVVTVSAAVLLSLVLGRFLHWYCSPGSYRTFLGAMTDYSSGGYALLGCFIGCLLTSAVSGFHQLGRRLDHMCLAGSLGIALGRLASLFDGTCRGQILASMHSLPWAYPVRNAVSGALEYRFATFMMQAMAAGMLFTILMVWYLRKRPKDGETALVFLLWYSASQILLDSTRYDSLYFRFNGFVSIVQIAGALCLLGIVLVFSARLVKSGNVKKRHILLWTMMAGMAALTGYMEYYVQRHGSQAGPAYGIMALCLLGLAGSAMRIRKEAVER